MLSIDSRLRLELLHPRHTEELYQLAVASRTHLQEWLGWVSMMQSIGFIENYISRSVKNQEEGLEYGFVIMEDNVMAGRIGIYKIDNYNKSGEIGYWVGRLYKGRGIITRSCKRLIDHCFDKLQLNRIEIRCATGNLLSQRVPERLGFKEEGILRQAEWLNSRFVDLKVYSLLKEERRW